MADDSPNRRARRPTEAVASFWVALDRGWQATLLGLTVVTGTVLLQAF